MKRDAGKQMVSEERGPRSLLGNPVGRPRWTSHARRLVVWACAGILVGQLSALSAKEERPTRVLSGVVSDAVDNPLPGAVVTLTDLQDGKKTATYTGQSGSYQFSQLQITRDYEVQATFKGVSSRVRRISAIDPRNRIVLNLRIPPPKEDE
jgi:hypothetical protein